MASRKVLASLAVRIGADTKGFVTGIKKAERQMKQFGNQMKSIGKTMSVALTAPIAALAVTSISAFNKQEKALGKVEQAVKSTGMVAGFTAKELALVAAELQKVTAIGDEDILGGVSAQLLTFTNITKENFLATQEAVLDVATVLSESAVPNFSELKSVALQLGKALNDPIANMGALSRSGIQFSEEQKKVIKELAATNRLGEAQAIMIKELNNQYGGQAKAAANGTAAIVQLKNIFGDLQEEMGEILFNMISPMIDKLKSLAEKFSNLSLSTKKTIVVVGLMVAAVGPLLVVLGILTAAAIPALTSALAFLISPLGLAITAVGLIAFAFVNMKLKAALATDELKGLNHELATETTKLNTLFSQLKRANEGTQLRKELLKEVNTQYGKYLPNLLTEKSSLNEITKAQNLANASLRSSIALKLRIKDITQIQTKQIRREQEALKELAKESNVSIGVISAAFNDMVNSGKPDEFGRVLFPLFKSLIDISEEYGNTSSEVFRKVNDLIHARNQDAEAIKTVTQLTDPLIDGLEKTAAAIGSLRSSIALKLRIKDITQIQTKQIRREQEALKELTKLINS